MSKSCFIPRTSFAVFIVFTTQTVFGYVPELNIWKDRQKTVMSTRRYASAAPVLQQWPQLRSEPGSSSVAPRWLKPFGEQKIRALASLLPHVPSAYGTVQKITMPEETPERTVFHIQDIHLNAEAQANIGNTVKALLESKKVDMVFLEGAFGPIAFDKYAQFPDQKAISKAADYLLKENRISGAVHTLLSHALIAVPTVGVDDQSHYDANVQAYRDAAPLQEQAKRQLDQVQKHLQDEKNRLFNSRLKSFDDRVEAYRTAQEKIGPYVQYLAQDVGGASPNTEIFLEAWRAETSLDFSQIQAARNRLVNDLMKTLSSGQTSELLRLSVAYRLGEISHVDFYETIKHLCQSAGVSLDRYPAMKAYVQYIFLSDAINGEKLFQDVVRLEQRGYAAFTKNRAEKDLVNQSQWLRLAMKLVEFSLTKVEWDEYKKAENSLLDLSAFEQFYVEAEARDRAMSTHVLQAMSDHKAKTAILVAGGFHSTGIETILKQSGVASVSFAPKVSKVEKENGTTSLSLFTQEKTPLDKLFEGEMLFLPPHTAQLASVGILTAIAAEGAHSVVPLNAKEKTELTKIGFPPGAVIYDGKSDTVHVTMPDRTRLLATMTSDEHHLIRSIRMIERNERERKWENIRENILAGFVLLGGVAGAWWLLNPYLSTLLWMAGAYYVAIFAVIFLGVGAFFVSRLNIHVKADLVRPTIEEIFFSGLPLLFAFDSVFPVLSESGSLAFYLFARSVFVLWHIFDEGLPKTLKQLWERVFLPTIISLIAVITYSTNSFFWALASHIVLNMFSEKIGDLFEHLGIDFDPEKANLGPLVRLNGKTSRLAKPIRPHWQVPFKLDGQNLITPGLLIPKQGANRTVDEDGVMDLVLDPRPGGRVFITENKAQMTYLTLYIMYGLMNRALRPYALGLATGGTQDEIRRVMGMPDLARRALGSVIPDFSRVRNWTTLDDYVWHPDQTKPGQDLDYRLSSYRQEQFYMLLRNIYPHMSEAEFDRYFISPLPAISKEAAAASWQEALKIFEHETNQILWQLGGIGTSSHFAFVETVLKMYREHGNVQMDLFEILRVQMSDFKEVRLNYGPMSEDGTFPLLDITKVQNAGYWVPRSFHPFFLRFMGENRFGDIPSMLLLLSLMSFDEVNTKFKEEKFRFRDYEHFLEELRYLIGNFRRVPDFALSQGVAGVLRRTYREDSFNITTVEGPHKAEALRQMLDVVPGPHSTAGLRHHLAPKSIVIATENSISKIDRRNTFQFETQNPNKDLFKADTVEQEWNQTPGGRQYQDLMQRRRNGTPGAFFFWKYLGLDPIWTVLVAAMAEGAVVGWAIHYGHGSFGTVMLIVLINFLIHTFGVALYDSDSEKLEFVSLWDGHPGFWSRYLAANLSAAQSLLPAVALSFQEISLMSSVLMAVVPHVLVNWGAIKTAAGHFSKLGFLLVFFLPLTDLKAAILPRAIETANQIPNTPESGTLLLVGLTVVGLALLMRHLWRTRHITLELTKMGDCILDAVTASKNGTIETDDRGQNNYLSGVIPITSLGVGGIDGRPYDGFFGLLGYQRRLLVGYIKEKLPSRTSKTITLAEARRLVLWSHGEKFDALDKLIPNANVGLDLNVGEPKDIPEAVATVVRVFSQMSPGTKLVLISAPRDVQDNWLNALSAKLGDRVVKDRLVFVSRHRHTFFVKTEDAGSALDAGVFLRAAELAQVRNLVLAVRGEYVLDPLTRKKYQQSGVLAQVAYIVDYLNDVMAFIVRDAIPVKHLDKLARAIAQSA